ncbi:hypothetical protein SAMN05414137_10323 [Streptacidiphilus jiangxiensis]|uniref:Phosphotransferase enzyme family protein n=2 Tax=Streptacidiphilus jiangxiensis TaxID=235985 RepID=A0A1H7IUQ0_STRJI|nr:hypothetical protein SAMN05414137_10323 [Streptacidiphilus jiangxiensis]
MRSVDLRLEPVEEILARAESALQVQLDRATLVRKRRSIGAVTTRGTWVRIERRPWAKVDGQGWNGTQSAASLHGIAKPQWYAGLTWRDSAEPAVWQVDETALLPCQPIGTAVLAEAPQLPDAWWKAFNASLDALAGSRTTRVATPDTETLTVGGITGAISAAFGVAVEADFGPWAPAHADLNWANMTGPEFCLFDWEDWGNAPRGLDAASLWAASLAVPELAKKVREERHEDLSGRDGKLMLLFALSKFAGPGAHPDDPRVAPGREEAARLLRQLDGV